MANNTFTEKELIRSGFEKEYSSDTIDGVPDYYYFVFSNPAAETLITSDSTETILGLFEVYMFNVKMPKSLSKKFVKMYIKEFR